MRDNGSICPFGVFCLINRGGFRVNIRHLPFKTKCFGSAAGVAILGGRKGQMANPTPEKSRNPYKTGENPTRAQLASSHKLASTWTKTTTKQGRKRKRLKDKSTHSHGATATNIEGKKHASANGLFASRGCLRNDNKISDNNIDKEPLNGPFLNGLFFRAIFGRENGTLRHSRKRPIKGGKGETAHWR